MTRYSFAVKRVFSSKLLAVTLLVPGVAWPLLHPQVSQSLGATPQAVNLKEILPGVVSRQPLNPPLRSGQTQLRFSPDGRYLFIQDPAGIFLFSHEPLKYLGYVETDQVFPAHFSPDSQKLQIVSHDLRVATRKIETGEGLEFRELPLKDGCLSAAISPNGLKFACYQLDFALKIFDLAEGAEVFGKPPKKEAPEHLRAILPLDTDGVYAGPIGYVPVDSFGPFANRGLLMTPLIFSPDGQELIAGEFGGDTVRVDLQSRKKMNIPDLLKKHSSSSILWLDKNHVLVLQTEKQGGPKIVSLENGAVESSPSFLADSVRASSNPRYLLLRDRNYSGERVFDLTENHLLEVPPNIGLDIQGSEMALFIEDGELYLYHIGDKLPYRMSHVPLGNLPPLRVASLDSSLGTVAFAVDGQGGVFSVAVGGRIENLTRFLAADFSESLSVFLTMPRTAQSLAQVVRFDTVSGTSSAVSLLGNETLRAGGSALFEYSFENPTGKGIVMTQFGGIAYRLRALDPASGHELWKRSFTEDTPVPFPDPQGSRLVLGWKGKSDGAREAARKHPAVERFLKGAKLDEHDTLFEVLDARSGKSLGGVLVQAGSRASSFDAAFSTGDSLVLLKDGIRVSLYSLSEGILRAKLVGRHPAASNLNSLLALDLGTGKLALYDSGTGAKLDLLLFPGEIAYSHFSLDGNRLFVLTQHQIAFVLDVSGVRHLPNSAVPQRSPE